MNTDHAALSRRLDELLEHSDHAFAEARLLLGQNSMTETDYAKLQDDLLSIQREADELITQLRSRLPAGNGPSGRSPRWQAVG